MDIFTKHAPKSQISRTTIYLGMAMTSVLILGVDGQAAIAGALNHASTADLNALPVGFFAVGAGLITVLGAAFSSVALIIAGLVLCVATVSTIFGAFAIEGALIIASSLYLAFLMRRRATIESRIDARLFDLKIMRQF